MFDTMTFTKVLGGFCGALLIYLLGGWAAEELYHMGGHGEQAYLIETDEGASEAEELEEELDFAAMVAAADSSAGEKVWGKCRACHALDGSDGTGPHLDGVVDRAKASIEGYAYSDILMEMSDQVWDIDALNGFLENPRGYAPGTKMGFAGLKKADDRADLVAYLQTTGS